MLGAMPQVKDRIVQMIEDIGFDPNDNTEDITTPIGIGNTVGNRFVEWSYSDGANQVHNSTQNWILQLQDFQFYLVG